MTLLRSIAAMPVRNVGLAAEFYAARLGFSTKHVDPSFAMVQRDDVELHLWAADDDSWTSRASLTIRPVGSGAESFLAGTASCRIEVQHIDALYSEMTGAEVLHPADPGAPSATDWGTREFAVLDLEGNLLTFFQSDGR